MFATTFMLLLISNLSHADDANMLYGPEWPGYTKLEVLVERVCSGVQRDGGDIEVLNKIGRDVEAIFLRYLKISEQTPNYQKHIVQFYNRYQNQFICKATIHYGKKHLFKQIVDSMRGMTPLLLEYFFQEDREHVFDVNAYEMVNGKPETFLDYLYDIKNGVNEFRAYSIPEINGLIEVFEDEYGALRSEGEKETKIKKMDELIQDIIKDSFEFGRQYFDKLNRYNNLSKNGFETVVDVDRLIVESVEKLQELNAWYPTVYVRKPLPKNSISISGETIDKYATCNSFQITTCGIDIVYNDKNQNIKKPSLIISLTWDEKDQTENKKPFQRIKINPYTNPIIYPDDYDHSDPWASERKHITALDFWSEYDGDMLLSRIEVSQYLYNNKGSLSSRKSIDRFVYNKETQIKSTLSEIKNNELIWDFEVPYVNSAINGEVKLYFPKGLGDYTDDIRYERGKLFFQALQKYNKFNSHSQVSKEAVFVVAEFKDGLPHGKFVATWPATENSGAVISNGWFFKGISVKSIPKSMNK
jgi:hypothetical protein